ncbi:biopolymer transporter ExbD [Zwartia sp.]|uniref:ExbD/TolR family protein n=1 Tax=Zwartia sp. TaxID=2978004 RepID=UPI00271E5F71|nr:biopolymer transporter ExbD [Zwartia sp.]MDO9023783.1 biopolymer transporter ExbD [Zwartia sp.]
MNFRPFNSADDAPDINLIPLIDVLLVILIFLAATTTFSREQQLKISLPQGSAEQLVMPSLEIAVSQDGRFAVAGEIVQKVDLVARLRTLAQTQPETVLVIRADAMAPHQSVIQAMQSAQEAGFSKVSFAIQATQ